MVPPMLFVKPQQTKRTCELTDYDPEHDDDDMDDDYADTYEVDSYDDMEDDY